MSQKAFLLCTLPQKEDLNTMTSEQDISQLTNKQLFDLMWELRGTPEVQPLYRELSQRPSSLSIQPDDPEWEAKFSAFLLGTPQPVTHP
jgi:hypothetical protein